MNAIILVSVAYITAQIFSDIGSLKIVYLFGFSIDAGTFIYPLTFTLRDLVHKTAGIKVARLLIFTAAVINIFMAFYFWMVAFLPPDLSVGMQKEFGIVLAPVWRIVLASILAEVISELLDTEIYKIWTDRITQRFQWSRVLISNSISVPIDSLLFSWCAFGGKMLSSVVWSIAVSNILIKFFTTFVSLPLIYIVREKPKSLEK
jgi:queuosine precursor transporter